MSSSRTCSKISLRLLIVGKKMEQVVDVPVQSALSFGSGSLEQVVDVPVQHRKSFSVTTVSDDFCGTGGGYSCSSWFARSSCTRPVKHWFVSGYAKLRGGAV